VYVLTAKRLAVVESGLTLKVRSIFPGDVHSIERTQRRDGCGNLKIVTGWTRDSEGGKVEKSETLIGVPEVRQVEDHIRGVLERAGQGQLSEGLICGQRVAVALTCSAGAPTVTARRRPAPQRDFAP